MSCATARRLTRGPTYTKGTLLLVPKPWSNRFLTWNPVPGSRYGFGDFLFQRAERRAEPMASFRPNRRSYTVELASAMCLSGEKTLRLAYCLSSSKGVKQASTSPSRELEYDIEVGEEEGGVNTLPFVFNVCDGAGFHAVSEEVNSNYCRTGLANLE